MTTIEAISSFSSLSNFFKLVVELLAFLNFVFFVKKEFEKNLKSFFFSLAALFGDMPMSFSQTSSVRFFGLENSFFLLL